MINRTRVPAYLWTLAALLAGVALGGALPGALMPVARGTALLIRAIVAVVPLLILTALSPAVATLVRRGLAGRFAGAVILWYMLSSALAGLLGLVVSSVLFGIPVSLADRGGWSEAANMMRALGE